jgi:RNA polymerase-binding transcription factor DksA
MANLDEARSILLTRRARLLDELGSLRELGHPTGAGHPSYEPGDWMDIARHHVDDGLASSVRQRLYDGLADVEAALDRLAADAYTRCEDCGDEIEPARLVALPSARRCVPCQARVESRRR